MKYTEEHEWLLAEGDIVIVGITKHAADALGELVFVELPDVGAEVAKDEDIVVIESVKAASDIVAPIDGEIVAVNEELLENPTLVNEDPLGKAWFFKIKPDNMSDLDGLMDEAAYNALIS